MQRNCADCGVSLTADTANTRCSACESALLKNRANPTVVMSPGGPPPQLEIVDFPSIPKIEILGLLGKGGMGAVFKARQTHLDRIVAIKVLRMDFQGDSAVEERFQREARALARLNHPNIVTVHDFGRSGEQYFLVMELVDGVNLREAMQAAPMLPEHALQVATSICEALDYAHSQGIVHRDMKPENVLIDSFGRVKIADFGLARLTGTPQQDRRLTSTGQIMGTLHYMAPEQIERPMEVDHRADLYALGVIFYEMLTQELPLGRFAMPSELRETDIRLDKIVLRALEKEPRKRYQKASEIHSILEHIRSTPPTLPSPKSWTPPVDSDSDPAVKLELQRVSSPHPQSSDSPVPSRPSAAGPYTVPEPYPPQANKPIRELSKQLRAYSYALIALAITTLYAGVEFDATPLVLPVLLATLTSGIVIGGQSRRVFKYYVRNNESRFRTYVRGLLRRGSRYFNLGLALGALGALLFPLAGSVTLLVFVAIASPFLAIGLTLIHVNRRILQTIKPSRTGAARMAQ